MDRVGSPVFGPPNPAVNATSRGNVQFGAAIQLAASGNILAVGAPKYDYATLSNASENVDGGALFVYQLDDGNDWDTTNPLFFLPGEAGEKMGEFFAINEDATRLAVRRFHQVPNSVEVYDLPSGLLVASLACAPSGTKQINGDAVSINAFGNAVAVSCNTAKGRVEVHAEDVDNTWMMLGELEGKANGDRFGFSTAFSASGQRLAVGSPNHLGSSGLVQVFEFESRPAPGIGTWIQLGNDIVGYMELEQLGFAIDISQNGMTVVASSPSADENTIGLNKGSVSLFNLNSSNSTWVKLATVFGEEAEDKFGRAVSVCSDGSSFAGSSWIHNQARGKVRIFQLQPSMDPAAVDVMEIASVEGDVRGDRVGQGRYSVSLSMAGGTLALAVGSSWSNHPDIDGSNAERSVGQVQVFALDELEILLQTDSPSKAPSEKPSTPTTTYPTDSPTEAPTRWPTQASTDSPTLVPPSINVLSDPPSSTPSGTSTFLPTITPSTAVPLSLGPLDWDLQRVGDISIRFSKATANEEIVYNYNSHNRVAKIQVFTDDCKTEVSPDIIEPSLTFMPLRASPTRTNLQVTLDVHHAMLGKSSIFNPVDAETGLLALCARVDLVAGTPETGQSVVFHEQKVLVTLNLVNNFTTSLDLARKATHTHVAEVNLEYSVTACQCNDDLKCEQAVLGSGDLVNICLRSSGDSIFITDVLSLQLTQGNFSHTTAFKGTVDDFTAVVLAPKGDYQLAVIQTFLISSFFEGESPGEVVVSGSCSLSFLGSGKRRLLSLPPTERNLGEEEEEASIAFGLNLELSAAESSGSMHISANLALILGTFCTLAPFMM